MEYILYVFFKTYNYYIATILIKSIKYKISAIKQCQQKKNKIKIK